MMSPAQAPKLQDSPPEPVAIVGIGCRFPGGIDTTSKLWEALRAPRDLSSRVPEDRWNVDKFYHPVGTHHGTTNVRESYVLQQDLRRFDAPFFSIGPAEADAMDPQHRMLLEVVYEAFEDAGYTLADMAGSDTAVYVGMMCTDYYATALLNPNHIPTYAATGISTSNASSRVSYHFDLRGPSMTTDTACSSSLVAIHHAVDQLRLRRSRIAIATGTNLLITPFSYISESNLHMLSPTGRSRMWDADADGYARGDGVACVLLKLLKDAIADGDEIQGIIRHTGFSHDGKTKGITMPSNDAQAALIRRTYAETGLDLSRKEDRPQFIEAHGTGTPIGDPLEASALAMAFFPSQAASTGAVSGGGEAKAVESDEQLFVGSIKTVVGHTEGTAGIAGVIKTALALRHAQVPPNLLFNNLAEKVAPFARNLKILKKVEPWPKLGAKDQPRRASVNSFGFGGTDAHAVMESYEPPASLVDASPAPAVLPMTFSASSESTLLQLLAKYRDFLESESGSAVDMGDLGYTLTCRRTALPHKVSFAASTVPKLHDAIKVFLDREPPPKVGRTAPDSSTNYLGIFTGQGAQWARMGADLLATSAMASDIVSKLEASTASLPDVGHRPSWSLRQELCAAADTSRIAEAAISQPLCTAVQIILVELLALAGIRFSAVVGHSSGEIGAAYAAGFLSATDAYLVAYYRGLCCSSSKAADGSKSKGSMMAVETSVEDAEDLCDAEDMQGRITIAAINSSTSVTLSGDADAILEAQEVFNAEDKFCRVLRVDQAYHSHHMLAYAGPYSDCLAKSKIQVRRPGLGAPVWFSSVREKAKVMQSNDGENLQELAGSYWVRNMISPVLFSEAVATAVSSPAMTGSLDAALEVGPHPALKAPATAVIKETTGKDSVLINNYFGTLRRGNNDVESLSEMLGNLWVQRGPDPLTLKVYQDSFVATGCSTTGAGQRQARKATGLPTYAWDHSKGYWAEARTTTNLLKEKGQFFHDLLGSKCPDGNDEEWRWTNLLHMEEIPWLQGHSLQGQVVFPTTGFIAMVLEASKQIAAAQEGSEIRLIEITDLEIGRGLPIQPTGSEVGVSMTAVNRQRDARGTSTITCRFACSSAVPGKDSSTMVTNCSGQVRITLGEMVPDILAPRQQPAGLRPVDVQEFNDELELLGYGYQAPWFRSIRSLERKLDQATGTVVVPSQWEHDSAGGVEQTPLMLHPGMLDSVLQGLFAAYSHPGDERLWTIHAPTHVARLAIVPGLCPTGSPEEDLLAFDSFCTNATLRGRIIGDIDLYTKGYQHKIAEIQGLTIVPLSPFSPLNDRCLFAGEHWYPDTPNGPRAIHGYRLDESLVVKAGAVERIALYYVRRSRDALHQASEAAKAKDEVLPLVRRAAMRWNDHLVEQVRLGKHGFLQKAWLQDTKETVNCLIDEYDLDSNADLALLQAVGENLPAVIQAGDEGNILEYMMEGGKLTRSYTEGISNLESNAWSAEMALQLAERYPQMNIIEIGAGTGGTTRGILGALGESYASYMYTDISAGFFPDAQASISKPGSPHQAKVVYKTLDVEVSVESQGFEAGYYDLAVAANVLHATVDIGDTLRNVRTLLKPGGYLLMVEIVDLLSIRAAVIYSGTPGWWIGAETGRPWGPTITLSEWDTLLKASGFTGVETSTPLLHPVATSTTVFLARAVDDDFRLLLNPMQLGSPAPCPTSINGDAHADGDDSQRHNYLVLLGTGAGPNSNRMAQEVRDLVVGSGRPWLDNQVLMVKTPEQLETALARLPTTHGDVSCTTLALGELDEHLFQNLTSTGWNGLRKLLAVSRVALWLTVGATNGTAPYSSMILGWLRSIVYEFRDCRFQSLDVGNSQGAPSSCPARVVAQALLRLRIQEQWARPGVKNATDKMLWSWEPELAWDTELGGTRLMRIKADGARNDRYNSLHRRILAPPPSNASSTVRLHWQHDGLTGQGRGYWTVKADDSVAADAVASADDLVIDTHYSLLNAFQTPNAGKQFLILGRARNTSDRDSDNFYLCLSTSLTSQVVVSRSTHAIPVAPDAVAYQPYLSFATAYLLCIRLLSLIPDYTTAVIHEPDPVLANLVANKAEAKHINVFFTTSHTFRAGRKNWAYIHPRTPQRALDALLPRDAAVFVHNGTGSPDRLTESIVRSLPSSCVQYDARDLLSAEGSASVLEKRASVVELLRAADQFAANLIYSITDSMPLPVATLDDIASAPNEFSRKIGARIISWTGSDPDTDLDLDTAAINGTISLSALTLPAAEVEVEPADRSCGGPRALFKPNVIYWLVGLAGDMGRSFWDWMTLHGARQVVFSSRNPKLPEDWVAEHTAKGHRVSVVAMDVTSLADVKRAKAKILATHAPGGVIAGVVTGAMIICDVPMVDMDYQSLQEVLQPKVEGTRNLDTVFGASSAEEGLEWFIALSSFIADTGNFGQLAYAAANCFQKALIRQRRRRGLPSASIDIAQVVGVGYVTREKATGRLDKHMSERLLKRSGIRPLSEADLHVMFAEAVLAAPVRSPCSDEDDVAADIITGPTRVTSEQAATEIMSAWAQNPRFAHFIRDADTSAATDGHGQNKDSSSRVPLKTRLAETTSQEEAFDMIKAAFVSKLMTGLSSDSLDETIPLTDLGVDSLVAVIVRDWAQQETGVNVPVLKILGGDSTVDIVNHIVQTLVASGKLDAEVVVDTDASSDSNSYNVLAASG